MNTKKKTTTTSYNITTHTKFASRNCVKRLFLVRMWEPREPERSQRKETLTLTNRKTREKRDNCNFTTISGHYFVYIQFFFCSWKTILLAKFHLCSPSYVKRCFSLLTLLLCVYPFKSTRNVYMRLIFHFTRALWFTKRGARECIRTCVLDRILIYDFYIGINFIQIHENWLCVARFDRTTMAFQRHKTRDLALGIYRPICVANQFSNASNYLHYLFTLKRKLIHKFLSR